MKYFILLILITVLLDSTGKSQDLSFNDLEYVLKQNSEEVSTYLAKKGFQFFKYEEAKDEYSCPSTHWTHNRNKINNYASAFIAKLCEEPLKGFVWYQPTNNKCYETIKSQCKNLGFIFKEKIFKKETNSVSFIYVNSKYKIDFTEGIDNNNENVYAIILRYIKK